MKQIHIKLHPNGRIEAETSGMKGKSCLAYIEMIERLTGAKAVDSDYKPEYFDVSDTVTDIIEAEVKA